MSGNCIQSLPPEIQYCKFLGNIDLNSNELVSLPETFGEIGFSLFELDLGNNKLESLPDNFGHLSRIVNLNVCDNKLTDLPVSMGQMKFLSKCLIDRNPIQNYDLLAKYSLTVDHVKEYLAKRLFLQTQEQKATSDKTAANKPGTTSNATKKKALATSDGAVESAKKEKSSARANATPILSAKEKARTISGSTTAMPPAQTPSKFSTGQTAPRSQPRMLNATPDIASPKQQQQQTLTSKQMQADQLVAVKSPQPLTPNGEDASAVEWNDEAEQLTKKIQKTVVFLKTESDLIKSALDGLGSQNSIGEVIGIAKAMKEVVQLCDETKQKYPVPANEPFQVNPECDQVTNLKLSTIYAVNEVESLLFHYLKTVTRRIYIPAQYEAFFALFLKLAHLMHEITKKFANEEQEQ